MSHPQAPERSAGLQPISLTNHDLWLQLAVFSKQRTTGILTRSQVRALMGVYDPLTPQSVSNLAESTLDSPFSDPKLFRKNPILEHVAFNYPSENPKDLALGNIGTLTTVDILLELLEPAHKLSFPPEAFFVPTYAGISIAGAHLSRVERFLQTQTGRLILAGTTDQPQVTLLSQ